MQPNISRTPHYSVTGDTGLLCITNSPPTQFTDRTTHYLGSDQFPNKKENMLPKIRPPCSKADTENLKQHFKLPPEIIKKLNSTNSYQELFPFKSFSVFSKKIFSTPLSFLNLNFSIPQCCCVFIMKFLWNTNNSRVKGLVRTSACCNSDDTWDTTISPPNTNSLIK